MRIAADVDVSAEDNEPIEVVEKRNREREAKAQALTLEMVGDLPFAEIRPPENILFVCKLNPVTRDEDLELIFSRFGDINSCEVIRDKKTGDSLCYAFIEFDQRQACEEAYFKMENVLIDDRRIHVDFSQSVSKLHGEWIDSRKSRMGPEGGNRFEVKEKYRERQDENYDLVFEQEDELHHELEEQYHIKDDHLTHRSSESSVRERDYNPKRKERRSPSPRRRRH